MRAELQLNFYSTKIRIILENTIRNLRKKSCLCSIFILSQYILAKSNRLKVKSDRWKASPKGCPR